MADTKQGNKARGFGNPKELITASVKEVINKVGQEGHIKYSVVQNEGINIKIFKNSIARPLFPFLKYTPIVGEIVLLITPNNTHEQDEEKSQAFYLPSLNIFNSPDHNIYTNNPEVKDNGNEYFVEKDYITPLLPLEGDFILEGRFGNSIRMGGSADPEKLKNYLQKHYPNLKDQKDGQHKIPWSADKKTISDPITIIKNEQNKSNNGKSYIEQVDKDGSSIYLTSTQKIYNLDKLVPSGVWPPKSFDIEINSSKVYSIDDYDDLQVDLSQNDRPPITTANHTIIQNGEVLDVDQELLNGGVAIYNNDGVVIGIKKNKNNADGFNLSTAQDDSPVVTTTNPGTTTNDSELSVLDQILLEQNKNEDSYYTYIPDHGQHSHGTDGVETRDDDGGDSNSTNTGTQPSDPNSNGYEVGHGSYSEYLAIGEDSYAIGIWPWGDPWTVGNATRSPRNGEGWYNIETQEQFNNLKECFDTFLYPLALEYGNNFKVSSALRAGRSGVSTKSAHYRGKAVDIVTQSSTTLNALMVWEWFDVNTSFNQLIFEFPTEGHEHVHVSLGRATQYLGATRNIGWASYLEITATPLNQERGIYKHMNPQKLYDLKPMDSHGPGKINFVPNSSNNPYANFNGAGEGENGGGISGYNYAISTDDL